jgi:hypothetical protein
MLVAMAMALGACTPPTPEPTPDTNGAQTITFDTSNTAIEVGGNVVTSASTDENGDLTFSVEPAAGMNVLWDDSMDASGDPLTITDNGDGTYSIVGASSAAEVYFISWPKTPSATPTFTGGGTEIDPYEIADVGDLQQLAADVFGGNFYEDKYFALTDNLSLSGFEWLPIGGGAAPPVEEDEKLVPVSFKGFFDGGGYTISGINYAHDAGEWSKGDSIKNNIGLFGKVDVGASVSNLTINDGSIAAQRSVGGIVGESWGTIDNCKNEGVTISASQTRGTGGIAGSSRIDGTEKPASTPIISNCTNAASVANTFEQDSSPSSNARQSSSASDSEANEDTSKGGSAGGIVGENEGLLYNSSNTGAISSTWNAGGLVGSNQNNVQQQKYAPGAEVITLGLIANSYNAGAVSGVCAGGIVGYQFASAANVYNYGAVTGTNAGEIIGELNVDTTDEDITNDYLYYRTGTTVVALDTSGEYNESESGGDFEYSDPDDLVYLLGLLNTWAGDAGNPYKSWIAGSDEHPTFN